MLSCVVYYLIDNFVCIDYLSFKSKTLISISSKPEFEQISFNILLNVGITELLLNLLSCHGLMKKTDSTVILNFRSRLVNNYLEKVTLTFVSQKSRANNKHGEIQYRKHQDVHRADR